MNNISITEKLRNLCPKIQLSCIECDVEITEKDDDLWKIINRRCADLEAILQTEDIKNNPAIAAARLAYKACGKDPARYRLSAEALLRRVVSGKGLYQINSVVDLLNFVSISTGFSIGGYDVDKIEGAVKMGVGEKDEPYTGLGRGELNIEGMPVFRDDKGAFGTSTSDSERTGVTLSTKRFLMVIVSYGSDEGLEEATELGTECLRQYASADQFEFELIKGQSKEV